MLSIFTRIQSKRSFSCFFNFIYKSYGTLKIVKTPYMADSITQGTLSSWTKKAGQRVKRDETVANIETDKVTIPVNSPEDGIINSLKVKEGDTVNVGDDLFELDIDHEGAKNMEKELDEKKQTESLATEALKTSIKQKKKLNPPPEQAIDLDQKEVKKSQTKETEPKSSDQRSIRSEPMTRLRIRIAERLKEAQNTAASLTTFNEIDMHNLTESRQRFNELIKEKHDIKIGFVSPFMMAVSRVLQELPVLNARVDSEKNSIVYHNYVDISVAVATEKGLVTPVVRNCQAMSLIEMEQELVNLSSKARQNKISIDELSGGTFTISNGGIFGSMLGTPIINIPQVAILGMHAIKPRPIAVNGQIQIRPHMFIALTYDHRIIDGREAATFLVKIKEMIEDPMRIFFQI